MVAASSCGTSAPRTLLVQRKPNCAGARPSPASEENLLSVIIYPNPAHDGVDVNYVAENSSQYSLKLTDCVGRVLLNRSGVSVEGENTLHIDLTGFAQGLYFIEMNNGGERIVRRIIVE